MDATPLTTPQQATSLPTATHQAAHHESEHEGAGGRERTISAGGQDRLLDLIRGVAIVRVVLWHTWSWAWLSWIPAMPAMFFTSGALLDRSLTRHGWAKTVRQRLRRLMIPYWLYAATCLVVMMADGWRPTLWQGLKWLIPLADPVGSSDMPGLWVPLWYIRAYLWFVLASGVIRALQRRTGTIIIAASSIGVVALWVLSLNGHDAPLAIGDAVAYLPFVVAGMHYSAKGGTRRSFPLAALAVAAMVASLWVVQRFGPDDKVVNRSYMLTLLVGAAGIAAAVAFRTKVTSASSARPPVMSAIRVLNSHALTIYLWQGFGLVAAQRLIDLRVGNALLSAALGVVVVTVVICGAVFLFGWVEEWAARKPPAPPGVGRLALASVPAAILVVALLLPLPADSKIEAPLSGRAVVARAGLIEKAIHGETGETADRTATSGQSPPTVLDDWVKANAELLDRIGTDSIEVALITPDGRTAVASWSREAAPSGRVGPADSPTAATDPAGSAGVSGDDLAWWSMTKAVTTAWMMRLVESGVVRLDDRLAEWVPEAPHGDEITIEQLARHTSGIPSSLDGSFLEETPISGVTKYFSSGDLAFRPGSGFNYSRIGYFLLALALERASSTTWVDAVNEMGKAAGVDVRFDDENTPFNHATDPDRHGYRGGLWASGGLITSLPDSVRLLQWIFSRGLAPASIEAMTEFSPDPDYWYYGLGLMPGCPCRVDGGHLRAERFGLDAATGLFSVDSGSGAVVMLRPDIWWQGKDPVVEFYDLSNRLLDSAAE